MLLATRVAFMRGRKFEEDDWADVYCRAKGLPKRGWSNLDIDIMHGSLGVEQKMMKVESKGDMSEQYGEVLMHPSATRSIRVPSPTTDPNVAMREVLTQYRDLILARTQKVRDESGLDVAPDMRIGWLLWQDSLRQFLYFEQEMLAPNPDDYVAIWNSRPSRGARKSSTNLWIYEKTNTGGQGQKRYSVTTEAGAKIQPYFNVPPMDEEHAYLFTVIGEVIDDGVVRVWVTEATHRELQQLVGLDRQSLSAAITAAALRVAAQPATVRSHAEVAVPLELTLEAYAALQSSFGGISDEISLQMFAEYLRGTR